MIKPVDVMMDVTIDWWLEQLYNEEHQKKQHKEYVKKFSQKTFSLIQFITFASFVVIIKFITIRADTKYSS